MHGSCSLWIQFYPAKIWCFWLPSMASNDCRSTFGSDSTVMKDLLLGNCSWKKCRWNCAYSIDFRKLHTQIALRCSLCTMGLMKWHLSGTTKLFFNSKDSVAEYSSYIQRWFRLFRHISHFKINFEKRRLADRCKSVDDVNVKILTWKGRSR